MPLGQQVALQKMRAEYEACRFGEIEARSAFDLACHNEEEVGAELSMVRDDLQNARDQIKML